MNLNHFERRQASNKKPSEPYKPNDRKAINDLLVVLQKQEDIMKHLTKDLEFFRTQFKDSLDYDNGNGNYLADTGYDDEPIDLRSYEDVGNGTIEEETVVHYIGYKGAMDNFQMGFEKTKNEIENIWKDVDLLRFTQGGSLNISKFQTDALEKGRKAAAQE